MDTATPPAVELEIVGDPMTQGSKSAVVGRDGRARVIEGRGTTGRRRFQAWRQAVTTQARAQYVGEPMDGPLAVDYPYPRARRNAAGSGRGADSTSTS